MPFKQLGLCVKKPFSHSNSLSHLFKNSIYPLCCAYESVSVTRRFLGCSPEVWTLWSWHRSAIGLSSWRVATTGASTLVLRGFVGCTCTARSVFISRCWLDNCFTINNNTKKVQKLKLNIHCRKIILSSLICLF